MANRYLKQVSGVLTEQEATVVSAGAGDAGEIVALDAAGRLDTSVMPSGIGADTSSIQASEALTAGNLVNIHDVAAAFRVRKADAAGGEGKRAHGFVLAGVSGGAQATVYFEGLNTQVTSVTPGTLYLSGSTPGGFTATAPTTAGHIVQPIGVGVASTAINFEAGVPIVLS